MKAVIIDDEFWTRDSIKRLADWERFGIEQVEEAEEGLSGLRIINEIHPDIVITDMRMRGMDGAELLKKLTEDYPFIRKIVISGFDDFAYTKQAILSRVDEYILKPVQAEELNRALEKAVSELRIARGLHAAQPMDKDLMSVVTEYKEQISRQFQELRAEDVRESFARLETLLRLQANTAPGLHHLLYKHFMLLLDELMAKAGIDSAKALPEQAASFFVTDFTPLGQWIGMLRSSYGAVLEQTIQLRQSKHRIDIEHIRQFINRSFAEPITLESIASLYFVSKEHLSRTFKQATGSTVMDYIVTKRVEEANRLLQSSVSIKNAAEAVGYSDLTYFHRIFKKVTGITPAQARKELAEQ
ncbi:helix-turn-helix domain-containing protein [Paenibacillus sp. JDR-2]|uniref:helix-turn-helix domain-containing protein n=1 Tax=Paenibacillus sp. (strain JDR-2) TaxID=324057 RepID=UPI0001667A97|nr:helix-turn-helix domain-containing protein [Paenibacillus sp. JDR-2]ACT02358.1 two component transcriptional regulator, AraC family [Paenibacillus sp. JDR-2]